MAARKKTPASSAKAVRSEDRFVPDATHRRIAIECFNGAWRLIEKPKRTEAEVESMILLAASSLWHWTRHAGCTDRHRSIGAWQVSRVFALAGDAAGARRFGRRSLACAGRLLPYFKGYAHEALARAAMLQGDAAAFEKHLEAARRCARLVPEGADRTRLVRDLESLAHPTA